MADGGAYAGILNAMTPTELKQVCVQQGLNEDGPKSALIKRLIAKNAEESDRGTMMTAKRTADLDRSPSNQTSKLARLKELRLLMSPNREGPSGASASEFAPVPVMPGAPETTAGVPLEEQRGQHSGSLSDPIMDLLKDIYSEMVVKDDLAALATKTDVQQLVSERVGALECKMGAMEARMGQLEAQVEQGKLTTAQSDPELAKKVQEIEQMLLT